MNAQIIWLDEPNDDLEAEDQTTDDEILLEEPAGGFLALGMAGQLSVVFSLIQKRVFKLKPSELRGLSLEVALGAEWCSFRLAQLKASAATAARLARKSPAESLATNIISACQAAGPYVEAQERRAGVWRDGDGQLIVNGSELWRPSDGSVLDHGVYGRYVYPSVRCSGFGRETPIATQEEVERALEAFRSLEWSTPMAGELVLGWLGVAVLAAAAHRRPHVLVTGPAGCGKSTLIQQVAWLLGDGAVACTGAPSLVGLRQLMRDRPSSAVTIDEFEADGRSERSKQTFEVARSAYSLQEGDTGVVRGSPGGSAISYRIASPFLAAGISPGQLEPADQSRWIVLEALRLSGNRRGDRRLLDEDEAKLLGPRLARLFVQRWEAFNGNLDVVRAAIRLRGGDARLGDTLGHLLAAFSTFRDARVMSSSEAESLVDMAGATERASGQVVHDEQECLTRLLSFVTTFDACESLRDMKRRLSIGQALQYVAANGPAAKSIAGRLAQLGIRVRRTSESIVTMVVNSPSHAELRKVFSGTKWSNGGWSLVLRRLPGGTESTQRIAQGMPACKVTIFNLPSELLPAARDIG